MEAREATRTLEPLNENGDEQEGENGGNGNGGDGGNGNGGNGGNRNGGNGGNGNGGNGENGNGNHGMNYGGFMPVARECTFQDFLKCQGHINFSGMKGCRFDPTCALTWWNSHKRTIGVDAAYAMNWAGLMRLMTEVYCPRNEIQKMETELWNLTVKGNDLTAYTQRLQDAVRIANQLMDKKLQEFAAGE
ncbi:reverse transcriptase domain-containing protein [Tanacetum coccineum]